MQVDKTKGCHGNKLHMSAVLRATEFIKHMESDQLPINQVMSTKSQEQIKSKTSCEICSSNCTLFGKAEFVFVWSQR